MTDDRRPATVDRRLTTGRPRAASPHPPRTGRGTGPGTLPGRCPPSAGAEGPEDSAPGEQDAAQAWARSIADLQQPVEARLADRRHRGGRNRRRAQSAVRLRGARGAARPGRDRDRDRTGRAGRDHRTGGTRAVDEQPRRAAPHRKPLGGADRFPEERRGGGRGGGGGGGGGGGRGSSSSLREETERRKDGRLPEVIGGPSTFRPSVFPSVMRAVGIEPTTYGLKARCSTN